MSPCWATWCAPCRIQGPHAERLSVELAGRIKVVKVDSDQAPAVAQRFGVRGVPTLLLLDKGRLLDRRTGALLGPQLRRWAEATIAHASAAWPSGIRELGRPQRTAGTALRG